MKKFIRLLSVIIILSTLLFPQQKYTLKMATVAPEGSSWMAEMRDFEKEIKELTNGRIQFQVYPNAVQGSEVDVLRKMRLGQLHSGTFTGVGLGTIVPDVRVLEIPFLFRNSDEIDYVYGTLFEHFQKRFLEEGFYLAGWAEVGLVYLYTHEKVESLQDFNKVKMWLWKGDPLARTAFEVCKISSIPLEVTDVHTSLQTGLINGVYVSPYALLALQWFTKVKYMLGYPLTNSIGAVLITKKQMDKMPEDLQKILMQKTKEYMRKIVLKSRTENLESIEVLKEAGIQVTPVRAATAIAEIDAAGKVIREKLVGELYSRELLDEMLRLLEEYRSTHGS